MSNNLKQKIPKRSFSGSVGAIIQARMGSERLPGKSLMEVDGKPILQHIVESLKISKKLSAIILATSDQKEDVSLLELAKKLGINGFAGNSNDVLARYTEAAKKFKLDVVVRVTGDNVLTDVDGMDKTIELYLQGKPDLATNGGKQGYPLGTGVEVLSTGLLQDLIKTVDSTVEREHVTLHVYRQQKKYRILYLKAPSQYRDLDVRLTIDTPNDLSLIRLLYGKLKEREEGFELPFVAKYLKRNQELKKINSHIKQRTF